MRKCRACVGGAEGRAGVGEAGCAASAQRTQTTGDADLTACARTSRLPARTSRLLARTSRLRARADCVGVRAAARADRADARAPLGATYARATLTHRRFLEMAGCRTNGANFPLCGARRTINKSRVGGSKHLVLYLVGRVRSL